MKCYLIKINVDGGLLCAFSVYAFDGEAAAICAQVHLQVKYDVEIY